MLIIIEVYIIKLFVGRKEEAIKDYSKAININPQYANDFYYRGLYYLNIY